MTTEYTPGEINISQTFLIGDNLTKKFNVLKTLNETKFITVTYASFWVINLCIDKITDILFGLKSHMETHPKVSVPAFGILDKDHRIISPSGQYWNEKEYLDSKI